MRAIKDRFGFFFWLRWILWFAGSFVLAAIFWTLGMQAVFGSIDGPELTIGWCVALFGSWFLLVIPFMRKKEQIWKRLNADQEKSVDAWFRGMGIFIGILTVSALFWSFYFREQIVMPGLQGSWAKAVFGTWLLTLVPFLILMYREADRIFKNAEARQTYTPTFQYDFMDPADRMLPESVAAKLNSIPPTLGKGHLVKVILKNGEKIPHVFVLNRREIVGIYDRPSLGFIGQDVAQIEKMDLYKLPVYDESKWLRIDLVNR